VIPAIPETKAEKLRVPEANLAKLKKKYKNKNVNKKHWVWLKL
jgi:hypothetical protein